MNLQIFSSYDTLSRHTAEHIAHLLRRKPNALICVASGETPLGVYRELVRMGQNGELTTGQCTFVGLDEWVGLGPEDEGSCTYFMYRDLFTPLGLRPDQLRLFNARSADLEAECRRMNDFIAERGGLDLMLVGIGMNGHIALNEPGTSFDVYAHVVELDEVTKTVGQKYFTKPTVLERGITLGLHHLLDAREAVLLAAGARKAPVVKKALTGPVSEQFPASVLQRHPNGYVWVDAEAADDLIS